MDAQFSLDTKIKVGIIGFGRMGRFYWEAMRKSGRWEIAYICDTDPTTRELAKKKSLKTRVYRLSGSSHWQTQGSNK